MNPHKALLLILALMGQLAIVLQSRPNPALPQVEREVSNGAQVYRSGKLKLTYHASGVDFEFGTEKRRIDLSRLPVYVNDCLDGASHCVSRRRTFCGTCIKYFDWVAWDQRRQRVFFAIATDTSRNKPWILAGYDFKSNQVTRFGEFHGGGAGDAVISPSGRYLAMKGYGVCGVCCTSIYLMVADLAAHRIGTAKPRSSPAQQETREVVRIDRILWAGENEIIYDELSYKEGDCSGGGDFPKKQSTESVKLSDIAFR